MAPIIIKEQVSRGIVRALASQFTSAAQAIRELVDNAIDAGRGQGVSISIEIDRAGGRFVFDSEGGTGMGPAQLEAFLHWGADLHGTSSDIGHYGQGGKAACSFLGSSLTLRSKPRGEDIFWQIQDEGWAARAEAAEYSLEATPLSQADEPMKSTPLDKGRVWIEVRGLTPGRRLSPDALRKDLSQVYGRIISRGLMSISVNGQPCAHQEIPIDERTSKIRIQASSGGVKISGWAGKVDKARLGERSHKPGWKVYAKRRLILDGEPMGINLYQKASVSLLTGELYIDGLTPNLNKSDFTERSDSVWDELCREVQKQAAPLLAALRSQGDVIQATKAEKRAATRVRKELADVLKSLAESQKNRDEGDGDDDGSDGKGRKKPEPSGGRKPEGDPAPTGRKNQPKTPPPANPIGRLTRIAGRLAKDGLPEFRVTAWEGRERTTSATEGQAKVILANKSYPAYSSFDGSDAYLAECYTMELFRNDPDTSTPADYHAKVSHVLAQWAQARDSAQAA